MIELKIEDEESLQTKMHHLHRNVLNIFIKYLFRRISRQLQSIKASMALRVWIDLIIFHLFYMKFLILTSITL